MDIRNDSGLLSEEEWLGYISLKAQFNEIFGEINERTQQTEQSKNDIASNEAEQVRKE
jgi:hypothetical protein